LFSVCPAFPYGGIDLEDEHNPDFWASLVNAC
jgi:hypothetical protein